MKCVEKELTGSIKRVRESEAERLIEDGWKYCSKSKWKEFRDRKKTKK